MCGYCTEQIALNNLREEVRGNLQIKDLGKLDQYYYLRETPDFLSALDKLRRSLAQRRLEFFSEVPPTVLLYRGMEVLLDQGFSSPAYQNLLKQQLFRDAVVATCSDENRKKFEQATQGLKIEHLGLLYDAETYFWGEHSRQLRNLAQILPSCRNLLKYYISWWLKGEELQKNDLGVMMEETGIFDPLNDITDEEHFRFELLFRAIYFSVLMVGSCSAGKKMLLAVSQRSLAGTPRFKAEELWLNRVAALKLYDLEGFDLFLKHLSIYESHRHYFYIDLIRGFTEEQKQMLLDEVNRQIDANYAENAGSLRLYSWLKNPHNHFISY